MRIRRIPKGGGRFRTIYVPNAKEKKRLQKLLPTLHELHQQAVTREGTFGVAHGFVPNRNAVTCALPHRGFQVTVSCDLENWFDTVREDQLVAAGVPSDIAQQITIDGVCRQGLPTSPVAANLAAVAMDQLILRELQRVKSEWRRFSCAYTRYADDLTISFSLDDNEACTSDRQQQTKEAVAVVLAIISQAARSMGWVIAERKTRIQHAKAGRRIVVGIAVDDRVQATRHTRRKLRASRYRASGRCPKKLLYKTSAASVIGKASHSAAGLAEWAACRLPRKCRPKRQIAGVLAGGDSSQSSLPSDSSGTTLVGGGRRILVAKFSTDSANS